MVTKAGALTKAAPKSGDDALLWILGGVVVMSLLKTGIKSINPIPQIKDAAEAVIETTKEGAEIAVEVAESAALVAIPSVSTYKLIKEALPFTALPKGEDESWMDYVSTIDFPGLPEYDLRNIPKNAREFQLEGWARTIPLINVREEDESWMDYVSTIDVPGLPKYDLRAAPGDIADIFGGIF